MLWVDCALLWNFSSLFTLWKGAFKRPNPFCLLWTEVPSPLEFTGVFLWEGRWLRIFSGTEQYNLWLTVACNCEAIFCIPHCLHLEETLECRAGLHCFRLQKLHYYHCHQLKLKKNIILSYLSWAIYVLSHEITKHSIKILIQCNHTKQEKALETNKTKRWKI